MKYIFVIFFIALFQFSNGQKKIEYFPQETIILSNCSEVENKSDCFYYSLEKKVNNFITENRTILKYAKNDTLKTGGRLIFDSEGNIIKEKSYFSISAKKVDKKIARNFKKIISKIEIKEIENRKSAPVNSFHALSYNYILRREGSITTFELLSNKKKYKGGIVEEIPRFPGCENLSESDARLCFQVKMQEHIRKNFNYPMEAQKKGLSGLVSVVFVISKEGEATKIRTRGPHKILEEDVVRIIKLLPNMTPGKQNGESVKVPYSIPITYKLQ